MIVYSEDQLAKLVPYPAEDANKYSRGKLVMVAGSSAYPGAACLSAAAAQRAGAGYVEVFTSPSNISLLQLFRPSLVVRDWSDVGAGRVLKGTSDRSPVAYAVGSGFDAEDPEAPEKLAAVLAVKAPVVIDGGALGMLADPELLALCQERAEKGLLTVLTPHGGEAARLADACGISVSEDQVEFAQSLASALEAVVALKGPDTFIADPDGAVACMSEGTPALAKAGTGDVLAGIIGSLLAQGLGGMDAAVLGATVHARAGKLAAEKFTDLGVNPEDILDLIPAAFSSFGANFE